MAGRGAMLAAAFSIMVSGCVTDAPRVYTPPPPPNTVLIGPIEAAPGHELVMGDNVFAPGAVIPAHSHPGEEFLLVQAGSVTMQLAGQEDRVLGPGEALHIPPGVIHSAAAGNDGARVVSNWIKPAGEALRIPAP